MRRTDYISWQQFFMGVAILASLRSKDSSTQVGSVIVDSENKIISTGYNGFPKLKDADADLIFPWSKNSTDQYETKYPYVIHAEANSILNASQPVKGCSLYVTWYPCHECAKLIVQSGISKVVYLNKHTHSDYDKSLQVSETMFKLARIDCFQYAESPTNVEF